MPNPSAPSSDRKIYGYLLAFFLVGIFSVYVPIHEFIVHINAIRSHADQIEFVKKAYYLLGGGLLFTVGPIWIIVLLLFGKETDKAQMKKAEFKRMERRLTTVALGDSKLLDKFLNDGRLSRVTGTALRCSRHTRRRQGF